MNATAQPAGFPDASGVTAAHQPRSAERMRIVVGGVDCEIRVRPILPIDELLGFEEEFDVDVFAGVDAASAAACTVADLLDSRMIAPPRPRRRRQRSMSSRALFFGHGG